MQETRQDLDSESLELRKFAVRDLHAVLSSWNLARITEQVLHDRRCRFVDGPIPTWHYGPKNAETILYETDGPDKHTQCATQSYMDSFQCIVYRLSLEPHRTYCSETMADFVTECLEGHLNLPPNSAYSVWKVQLERNLAFATQILEEKDSLKNAKGIFQCPGCKSYDVDTEQKQTRSADEPMTIFCSCVACGRKFVR